MHNLSRIVKINNYTIVTNFKCMFSSLNLLSIEEYNPIIKKNVIFLYRNIFKKLISCFLHWSVCYIDKDDKKWLNDILSNLKCFDFNQFSKLIKNNKLIDGFKLFLDNLKFIYNKNPHLHPQIKIIKDNKIKNISKFINIDNYNELCTFENLVNQKTTKIVSSCKINSSKLLDFINNNIYYKKLIKEIYIDDINYFKKFNINIF